MVDDQRVPVEHELVLASDERAERDHGEVVASALDEHPLALEPLADVVRGRGDVDQDGGAGERLIGSGRSGLPDVFADGQPDGQVADRDQRPLRSRLEVALLVEDAVVGQDHLPVDGLHRAVGEHGAGVVYVLGKLGESDQRHDPVDLRGEELECLACIAEEVLLEQQILGRVAGDRQLRKQHQLSAGALRGVDPVGDLFLVTGDVPDRRIHLAQGELQ